MIKYIVKNVNGTDYICSDIHGHFYILEAELKNVSFNEETDRLFSLGDLIDRGDDSDQVLEWLEKPWFYAIQGNHERILINAYESQSDMLRHQWFAWGGQWAEDITDEEIEPFYNALSKLPIAIELELSNNAKVGLVHAELPNKCDWNDLTKLLETAKPKDIEATREISDLLWKKSQPFGTTDEILEIEPVTNIHHVFHVHTIVSDYHTITNRTFMDLGSYETGKIGFVDLIDFLKSR
ncbi:MAG: serine/threonine protein phosphatase 1 [Ulvibacter sp.]|jgi:serine/threonine protein phosphatase 1